MQIKKLKQNTKKSPKKIQSIFYLLKPTTYNLTPNAGFTLIELIVVMGILTVMSSVVLANHAQFGDKLLLRNLSYEIALSVREMQVFGLSARKTFATVVVSQKRAHGVHFDSNNRVSYLQFVDTSAGISYRYDGSAELVESININPKYTIDDLCAKSIGGSYSCGLSSLDISFLRPNPDAVIRVNADPTTQYEEAKIVITTRRTGGDKRAIIVGAAGQISVKKITTP